MTRQSTKDFFKEYFSKEETKKKLFKPNVEEDLNRPHNVTLTEGQISTILYIMEGYLQGSDDNELVEKLDGICYRIQRQIEVQSAT